MRTLPGKVVADGPHHVALGGVAPHLEPFLHGPVYHIRCGKDVQQRVLVIMPLVNSSSGRLVGTLDDGHHRTVLLAYLLVAEGDCGMYADILASGLHLRRLGILVKNDHSPSGPVGKDLVMNHVEDQGHDRSERNLSCLICVRLEHDQPPVPEIGHSVGPAYIGIPFTGKELAAYEAEGGQVKIIGVYVLPPANILIMLRHVAVERGKGMGRQAGGVIIPDEFCEGLRTAPPRPSRTCGARNAARYPIAPLSCCCQGNGPPDRRDSGPAVSPPVIVHMQRDFRIKFCRAVRKSTRTPPPPRYSPAR